MSKTQGALANESGKKGEISTLKLLKLLGFKPQKLSYKPAKSKREVHKKRTDHYIPELGLVLENKHQDVSGTADQKLENEIFNATRNFTDANLIPQGIEPIRHYAIVLSGKHWTKPGPNHKIRVARELIQVLKTAGQFQDLKTVQIISKEELPQFIQQIEAEHDK